MRYLSFVLMGFAMALCLLPQATHAAMVELQPGDLIKGRASTVYYYGTDGRRYVFPNEKTYFTWYPDFKGVKIVSDVALATIPLGASNITYRPGMKMVKIEADPKVYVIDRGGFLRHVASEQLAESFYGLSWKSLIEDVPAVFFQNYKVGTPVLAPMDFQPAMVSTLTWTITQDKFLPENTITIAAGGEMAGFVPNSFTIKPGTTVVWVNRGSTASRIVMDGWQSPLLNVSESVSRVFDRVGIYNFTDAQWTAIRGTIQVK